tara:strand:+ start:115 stop:1005 length:891 start_codon:yes stop_codon:yes gene_type:complete
MGAATYQTEDVGPDPGDIQIVNLELRRLFESRKEQNIDPFIKDIIDTTERMVTGLTTDQFEFTESDGKPVKKGTSYHIHYTNDLNVYFMTGIDHHKTSRLIYPRDVKKTIIGYYNSLNQQTPSIIQSSTPIPTEDDYLNGSYTRYFAKKANDDSEPVFEVTAEISGTSSLYNFVSLDWSISGPRHSVFLLNMVAMNRASQTISSIKTLLSPFQFYRFSENLSAVDALKNRLNGIDLSGYNTVTGASGLIQGSSSGTLDEILNADGEYIEGASGVNDGRVDGQGISIPDEDRVCTDA